MTDKATSINTVTRIIHWSFALFLICMLCLGFYMINTQYSPDLYQIHKSFGVLFCLLMVMRLIWRIKNPWRSSSQDTNNARLVTYTHFMLILLMGLIPLTGFMISAFSGFGIHVFQLQIVPENVTANNKITPFNDVIYQASKTLHYVFNCIFSVLILGHLLAALKHHLILKDNTLTRMLGRYSNN